MRLAPIFILFFVFFLCQGCIAQKGLNRDSYDEKDLSQDRLKNLLIQLVVFYEKENKREFMGLVSDRFYPIPYTEFQYRIEEDLRQINHIDIALFIDKVVSDSQYIAIHSHWIENYLPNGQAYLSMREGRTVFIFAREEGGPKLINFNGDTLFGFTSPGS